ncbi:MAG: hypothetical protein OXE76_14920 [Alphaproteobacteria bacterium]|nr:hypothetical protein [Alphaproteobacteria bacterium]
MPQSQISRRLGGARERARIAAILSQEQFESRSALGRRICREFSFFDTTGRPQLAGCMKALSALAERGADIVLPAAQALAVDNSPRLLALGVPEPEEVPAHPASIRGLVLTVVAAAVCGAGPLDDVER